MMLGRPARPVWADTAYRSAANEAFLDKHGFVSRIHRKKPKGRAMPAATRRANNAKSKIRSRVEHVFAEQKVRIGLFVRTIGIGPLVQLLDATTLRVEAVDARDAERATFSSRAVTLVR